MAYSQTPVAAEIVSLGAGQRGIVDLGDLSGAGVARSTTARWVESRRLHRLYPGVYSVIPPSMLSQEARWLAAVKACGPGAFLSHGPSGQVHGIIARKHRYALDVSVADRRRVRIPGVVVHRPRELHAVDTTTRLGISVTTATRAIWDMSTTHPDQPIRRAFEKAERFGLLNRIRLATLAASHPNRKGSGLIRTLLAERPLPAAEVRSWLEELLWTTCTENRLPLPAVNVPLLAYEVDFLWEQARFVVEADGGDHLTPSLRDRDNARDFALQRAGYLVRRYSYRDMSRPREVAAEIRAILPERGSLR